MNGTLGAVLLPLLLPTGQLQSTPLPVVATTPVGHWLDEQGAATVAIHACDDGDGLCATLVALAEPVDADGVPRKDRFNADLSRREQPLVGLQLMTKLRPTPRGTWKGQMYAPRRGRDLPVELRVVPDGRLALRLTIGILRETVVWTPTPTPAPPPATTPDH